MPNGTIRTSDLLDRETTNLYNLIVTANDCAKEFSIIYNQYSIEDYTTNSNDQRHEFKYSPNILNYSNKRNHNNLSLADAEAIDIDIDIDSNSDIDHMAEYRQHYENHLSRMKADNFNTKPNHNHYHHQYVKTAKDQSDQSAIYLKSRPRQKRQHQLHKYPNVYQQLGNRNAGQQTSTTQHDINRPEKCYSTTTQASKQHHLSIKYSQLNVNLSRKLN